MVKLSRTDLVFANIDLQKSMKAHISFLRLSYKTYHRSE